MTLPATALAAASSAACEAGCRRASDFAWVACREQSGLASDARVAVGQRPSDSACNQSACSCYLAFRFLLLRVLDDLRHHLPVSHPTHALHGLIRSSALSALQDRAPGALGCALLGRNWEAVRSLELLS